MTPHPVPVSGEKKPDWHLNLTRSLADVWGIKPEPVAPVVVRPKPKAAPKPKREPKPKPRVKFAGYQPWEPRW